MADQPDSAIRSFDFPLRFTAKGDLVKTQDDSAIQQNIINAIMTVVKGIPLRTEFGSMVSKLAFDPVTVIATRIGSLSARAVALMEPRAVLDPRPLISLDTSGHTVRAKFSYYVRSYGREWKTVSLDLFERR